jgi:tetratricopeptide (TPR) repeat protein
VRRLDEAVEALHRSLAAQPTFASTLALLAQIEMDSGRWQDAFKYLQPLYEAYPRLPLAREKMAVYHLHAGDAAEQGRDPVAAERHYRAGLDMQAENAGLDAQLGALLLGQRRFAEALAPLEAFRQLAPNDARGALLLGQAYAALGRREEARRTFGDGATVAEQAGDAALAQHCREALQRLQ